MQKDIYIFFINRENGRVENAEVKWNREEVVYV